MNVFLVDFRILADIKSWEWTFFILTGYRFRLQTARSGADGLNAANTTGWGSSLAAGAIWFGPGLRCHLKGIRSFGGNVPFARARKYWAAFLVELEPPCRFSKMVARSFQVWVKDGAKSRCCIIPWMCLDKHFWNQNSKSQEWWNKLRETKYDNQRYTKPANQNKFLSVTRGKLVLLSAGSTSIGGWLNVSEEMYSFTSTKTSKGSLARFVLLASSNS